MCELWEYEWVFLRKGERSLAVHVYLSGHGRIRVADTWFDQLPGNAFVFDSNVPHEVVNGASERIVLYMELDVDVFMWKTEGLDLRAQPSLISQ